MSRFKRFAHSLISGYVLLGANMIYTLASVPLALHYLGKAEFGLWALATTLGGYIMLMDFGLGASVARILIDHKDDPRDGHYGGMIQTGLLVGMVQGALILLVGSVLAHFAGQLLDVDVGMRPALKWLMIGQCAVLALSSALRTFSHILSAHQRFDITNYGQAIVLGLGLAIMWVGFARGLGVYSFLLAQALTTAVIVVINLVGCLKLGLLPKRGEWGKPTWHAFKGVFSYGNDIFIYSLGCQLINFGQSILLTRLIGLEAVTVWSVFTRIFVLLQQTIYRIFDYSSSAFAEMIVRGERELLARRFRQVVVLSTSLSVAAAAVFAVCNKPFVDAWTGGRFESPLLVASDIKAPKVMAQRLTSHEDPAAQFVWEQLSDATREQIANPQVTPEAIENTQKLLAADLNRLIQSETLLQSKRLNPTTALSLLQPATMNVSTQLARAWFNRHVIEDDFAAEIADSRKAHWSNWNNLLLAIWLVIMVSMHAHTGLVGQAKAFGFMRYIFFLEGIVFIGLSILIHTWGGITGMLCASVAATLLFSFSYGLWRTGRYFQLGWRELAEWHRAPWKLFLWVLPVSVGLYWITYGLSPVLKLVVDGTLLGIWAVGGLLRYGLEGTLQTELLKRIPIRFRGLAERLASVKSRH